MQKGRLGRCGWGLWCVVVVRMRKGGNENRVCFGGGSYLGARYCVERGGGGELYVGTVAWQGGMVSGQRVVCMQVRMGNQQTTGRALGKGWGSLP